MISDSTSVEPACRYCRDRLRLAVTPVGAAGEARDSVARVGDAVTMWCPCAHRPQLIMRALEVYIDAHGYPPSLRELGRISGMATQTAVDAVRRLEAAGLVVRGRHEHGGKGQSRALRLVKEE